MSYYGILKQAEFADKIGNYRLADNLISKLIRLAKPGPKEIGLLFGIDDLLRRIKPPKGAKTLPQKLDDLVKQSVLRVVLEVRKVTPGPELEKSFDEIGVPPGYRKNLANMLKSGDPEKIAKAEAYLSKKISNKYEADIKAAETVPPPSDPKPPSDPRPPETPPTKIDPEEAKRALKEEIEKIVAEAKGDPKVIREKLRAMGFDDKTIANATAGDVININTLTGATKPGGMPFLSSRHIQVGDEILELSKIDFLNAQRLLIDIKDLPEDSKLKLIKKLVAMLNRDGNLVLDARLKDTGMFDSKYFAVRATTPPPGETPDPTAPTTPGSTADEAVEAVSNPNKKLWLAWVAGIGTAALLDYGWTVINGTIVHKDTGKPVTDEEGNAAMNSAGAGAGSQFKSKSDMYEQRMRTNPNQQMMKGSKPQEFVDANKGKYKTQREFYEAAKAAAAGDENFANSVIAIVKKDLDLFVSDKDQRKF